MPPVNHAVAATVGIVVASVAVAAAIAAFENPEVRRVADNLRRRIAIALHSLGDNFDDSRRRDADPSAEEPLFNRPEDAQGFLVSRHSPHANADPGMDADDETRRRQREELMYWNAMREKNQCRQEEEEQRNRDPQNEKAQDGQQSGQQDGHDQENGISLPTFEQRPDPSRIRPTFDDFLTQDRTAEQGTYVYNTGAQPAGDDHGLHFRRRGPVPPPPAPRGISGLDTAAAYANPFGDEHGIDWDDRIDHEQQQNNMMAPDRDELSSEATDIYDASPRPARPESSKTTSLRSVPPMPVSEAATGTVLFDWQDALTHLHGSDQPHEQQSESVKAEDEDASGSNFSSPSTPTLASVTPSSLTIPEPPGGLLDQEQSAEPEAHHGIAQADQGDGEEDDDDDSGSHVQQDAYASIQAWAQGSSNPSFYSPLPETPSAPMSEGEMISEGQLTPTDSMSVVDAPSGEGVVVSHNDAASPRLDVLSESEGVPTPSSWSEVGSVGWERDERE